MLDYPIVLHVKVGGDNLNNATYLEESGKLMITRHQALYVTVMRS